MVFGSASRAGVRVCQGNGSGLEGQDLWLWEAKSRGGKERIVTKLLQEDLYWDCLLCLFH